MNIINDKVSQYIDNIYKPLNDFLADLREDSESKRVPIILKDTELFLLNLIRMKKPTRILEIGTAVGYSASCFASVSLDVRITSLEVSDIMYKTATENIQLRGLADRIQIILGDAKESLKELKNEMIDISNEGFDMVFIDAAKAQYKEFWDGSIELCKEGAVIISDNVLLKARTASDEFITEKRQKNMVKKMREYIQYITNLDYADTSVLSIGDGIAFSILRGQK